MGAQRVPSSRLFQGRVRGGGQRAASVAGYRVHRWGQLWAALRLPVATGASWAACHASVRALCARGCVGARVGEVQAGGVTEVFAE